VPASVAVAVMAGSLVAAPDSRLRRRPVTSPCARALDPSTPRRVIRAVGANSVPCC